MSEISPMKNTYFKTNPNPSIICENNQDNSLSIKGEYEYYLDFRMPQAVIRRCSVKKVFLKISQNSQENTCA